MLEDKLEKPASDFNFYVPVNVARKLLEELPATIDYVQHRLSTTTTEIQKPTADQYFSMITEQLLVAYENREYYIGIKQSNLYGSYQIYLSRHMLTADQDKISEFCLTIPAARALMGYLSQIFITSNSQVFNLESQIPTEPKNIPLESATTDMV
jgi:hypothetical protein